MVGQGNPILGGTGNFPVQAGNLPACAPVPPTVWEFQCLCQRIRSVCIQVRLKPCSKSEMRPDSPHVIFPAGQFPPSMPTFFRASRKHILAANGGPRKDVRPPARLRNIHIRWGGAAAPPWIRFRPLFYPIRSPGSSWVGHETRTKAIQRTATFSPSSFIPSHLCLSV
jgi:hypothetical protein